MSSPTKNPFRLLPSVEEVLARPEVAALGQRVSRELLTGFVRAVLDGLRAEIQDGLAAAPLERRLADGWLAAELERRVAREERRGLVRVLNATGVVLNTGLGRAPVHPEAARAMATAAGSYCVLEVERESGRRNRRDDRLSELLARLTGAEAAIAVNNNAAACLLALQALAGGRETVVSRGELVEIGGSFRMPDVMERAGTRLVEVGTTNRTRVADYRAAIGPDTGLLLKVHRSNFRLQGFTEEPTCEELAELGRSTGVPVVYDLGSGLIECAGATPLADLEEEPLVLPAVQSGLDAVTFSGDKLFGGPQAGLIVGLKEAVDEMRASPLYRALRLDKVSLAGLERTLELMLAGRADELPVRAMLLAGAETLGERARALAARLEGLPGLAVGVEESGSQPGSGSAPGIELPTWVVRLDPRGRSAERLAAQLRAADPPVFARIQDDAVLLDPRTLLPGEEDELVAVLSAVLQA